MKYFKWILLAAVTVLTAVSCWKDDKHRNKYVFGLDCDFEYSDIKFEDDSVFVVPNIFAGTGLVCFSSEVTDGALAGGFCIAGGVDPDLTEHAAKTPFHTVAHQRFDDETAFLVFHQTEHMPEKLIRMTLYNEQCSIAPQVLLVNNTHRFVQAARFGTGLAGGPFTAEDWAKVTFTGYLGGVKTGEVTFSLADMTKDENPVVTTWETVDLAPLGNVDEMKLSLTSSREDMVKDVCFDHIVFQCNIEY